MTFSNVSDNNYYLLKPGFNRSSRATYTIFPPSTNNFYMTMSVGRALLLNPDNPQIDGCSVLAHSDWCEITLIFTDHH